MLFTLVPNWAIEHHSDLEVRLAGSRVYRTYEEALSVMNGYHGTGTWQIWGVDASLADTIKTRGKNRVLICDRPTFPLGFVDLE